MGEVYSPHRHIFLFPFCVTFTYRGIYNYELLDIIFFLFALCLVILRLIINLRSFAVTKGAREEGEGNKLQSSREPKQYFDGTEENLREKIKNVPIMIIEKYHYTISSPVQKQKNWVALDDEENKSNDRQFFNEFKYSENVRGWMKVVGLSKEVSKGLKAM